MSLRDIFGSLVRAACSGLPEVVGERFVVQVAQILGSDEHRSGMY